MKNKKMQTISATKALVAKSEGFANDVYKKLLVHVQKTDTTFGSNKDICKWLNFNQVKTARGKSCWQVTQVSRILKKLTPDKVDLLFNYKTQEDHDDFYDEDDLSSIEEFMRSNDSRWV